MPDVVGVRFKPVTKIYYFLPPNEILLQVGDPVIVETSRGKELGWVALEKKAVSSSQVKGKLKTVLRRATPIDLMTMNEYEQKRQVALEKCKAKVEELNLPMKVVEAEYSYDGSRVLFSFSAEQRVDFRDLVRALVRSLRARVEMRQIGARDEAKIIDGYGRCGRRLCCSSWLTEFHPVSIRMAKNQQLPLAPTEISGVCGRLLCCLAYEDNLYTELRKTMPKIGSKIKLPDGPGKIRGLNILKQTIIVQLEETGTRVEVDIATMEEDVPEKDLKPQTYSQPKRKPQAHSKSSATQQAGEKPPQAKPSQKSSAKTPKPRKRRRSRGRQRKRKSQPKTD